MQPETTGRSVLLDFHYPEWDPRIAAGADAKEIVSSFVRADVNRAVFYMKDIFGNAYYPTKTGHIHNNFKNRDFFNECVTEARRNSLSVIVECIIVWDTYCAKAHPEWVMVDSKGNPQNTGLGYMCYNSGYKDYLFNMVREVIEAYDIDGFFFDMLIYAWAGEWVLTCYCDNCKKLFEEEFGHKMPTEPTWNDEWRHFLDFRYKSNERFARDLVNMIKKTDRKLTVTFNYHGAPYCDWRIGQRPVQHSAFADYGVGEAYTGQFGIPYTSLYPRFLRGLVEGRPYEVATFRFNRNWDYTVKPVAHLQYEIMTYLANGANALIVDQPGYDGKIDQVVYDRIGQVYAEAKEKTPLFQGYQPLKHVALYYSAKTRDWYARETMEKYQLSFNGAFKAILESHISVDILFDETIELTRLQKYPVLFLANVAILDEKEIEIITEYVNSGGVLIATDDTSLYDINGERQDDFGLANLFNAHFKDKTETTYNYFQLPSGLFSDGIHPKYDMLLLGPGNVVDSNGETFGDLKISFFDRTSDKVISHGVHPAFKRVSPAIVLNEYGKGKVAFVPFKLDASYASNSMLGEHRILMKNLIRELTPEPVIEVDAPLNVEAVVTTNKNESEFLVHLIGFNATRQALTGRTSDLGHPESGIRPELMMEEPLLYEATIKVNQNFKSAKAWNEKTQLNRQKNVIQLLCRDVHETVTITI